MPMQEINVVSTIDQSPEPNLLYLPKTEGKVPLVVGLHTWSAYRDNQVGRMLPYAEKRQWALLLPEFRGANLPDNPRACEACGSELAKQDIIDAVDQVLADHGDMIDTDKIFLLGGSGGGHMSLLMAAYRPTLWRMVSCWCPITDLTAWHEQSSAYRPGIAACCGGTPEEMPEEYVKRSPISHIDAIAQGNNVVIHHGRWDGVIGSVPFTHSLNFYNALVAAHPKARVFLDIFDGGHELHYDAAFKALEKSLEVENQSTLTG